MKPNLIKPLCMFCYRSFFIGKKISNFLNCHLSKLVLDDSIFSSTGLHRRKQSKENSTKRITFVPDWAALINLNMNTYGVGALSRNFNFLRIAFS